MNSAEVANQLVNPTNNRLDSDLSAAQLFVDDRSAFSGTVIGRPQVVDDLSSDAGTVINRPQFIDDMSETGTVISLR